MYPQRRLALGMGLPLAIWAPPLFNEQVPFFGGLQVKCVQPEIDSLFYFKLCKLNLVDNLINIQVYFTQPLIYIQSAQGKFARE